MPEASGGKINPLSKFALAAVGLISTLGKLRCRSYSCSKAFCQRVYLSKLTELMLHFYFIFLNWQSNVSAISKKKIEVSPWRNCHWEGICDKIWPFEEIDPISLGLLFYSECLMWSLSAVTVRVKSQGQNPALGDSRFPDEMRCPVWKESAQNGPQAGQVGGCCTWLISFPGATSNSG